MNETKSSRINNHHQDVDIIALPLKRAGGLQGSGPQN